MELDQAGGTQADSNIFSSADGKTRAVRLSENCTETAC